MSDYGIEPPQMLDMSEQEASRERLIDLRSLEVRKVDTLRVYEELLSHKRFAITMDAFIDLSQPDALQELIDDIARRIAIDNLSGSK